MAELNIGQKAPDFTLPTADGGSVSLKDLKGSTVILYFYPKDDTPGCTKEACEFRDNIKVLRKKGVVVIGVSADGVESHRKFTDKYKLPFTLVSDEKKEVIGKYGVWKEKSLYGRTFMGIQRTTFVIDTQGTISHIFSKVKVAGHVDELLELLAQ